jgi:hypothetical protein
VLRSRPNEDAHERSAITKASIRRRVDKKPRRKNGGPLPPGTEARLRASYQRITRYERLLKSGRIGAGLVFLHMYWSIFKSKLSGLR